MCFDRYKAQLIIDEGKSLTVYHDSEGYLTVGIGHLVLPGDKLEDGQTITEDQCDEFFREDICHAIDGVHELIPAGVFIPADVIDVLVNMCFNLGKTGLGEFHHFLLAIVAHNWPRAAFEMKNSLWFKQVGARAQRLYDIIRNQPHNENA